VRSIFYRKAGEKFLAEEIDVLQKKNQAEILGCEGIEWVAEPLAPTGTKFWYLIRQDKPELQSLMYPGSLNDTVLEIRTWDQAAVETNAIKQDQIDKLKGI
jgi:hypothetical protein